MNEIRRLREKKQLSQAQLAEMAGTSQPQIKRLEDGARKLTKEWAERLAPHLETTAEGLLFPQSTVEDLTRVASPIGAVPVTGKVAANTWLSVEDMDFGYDDIEYVPSASGYPVDLQFALKVEGNCLNKIANHGDRLICLDIAKTGIEVEDGDLVIVERSRFEGQMIERTAKRLRRTADGYELWPESHDPAHQDPITLNRPTNGDAVRIIGKVLWIMRKP
ncbi:helix-turn-helix domain-containing protein [Ochrobactrum sp. A-1]|uniref:helix-turn-helix domain-containing protein n=1 Tax=Ochrobactrum sp. A-1 TaxID=2920940 RepID=UPI001F0A0AC9|nr:helix-turn-helix domain-containing protein [Ochrobactrum sp. A-1]